MGVLPFSSLFNISLILLGPGTGAGTSARPSQVKSYSQPKERRGSLRKVAIGYAEELAWKAVGEVDCCVELVGSAVEAGGKITSSPSRQARA